MPKIHRHAASRPQMLRMLSGVRVAAATTSAMLLVAGSAFANNDPHRIFLLQGAFDIPATVCGFPIHVEVPIDKVYAKVSTAPDGSTVFKATGSLFVTVTNQANGKTITLNVSGPATYTFPANSTLGIFDFRGLGLEFVTNGAAFGLPNFMYTAGPFEFTIDLATDTIVSVARPPQVQLDVCAALS